MKSKMPDLKDFEDFIPPEDDNPNELNHQVDNQVPNPK
jgi:hypothetical protein